MVTHITEKPTAVAAAAGWYIVKPSLELSAGEPGYEDLLARAKPEDVDLWLQPIIAWRIDFRPRDPHAPVDKDTKDAWPGLDSASPITLDGNEGPWKDYVFKTPDGTFTNPQVADWDDEASFRAWYLDELRKETGDVADLNLDLGTF